MMFGVEILDQIKDNTKNLDKFEILLDSLTEDYKNSKKNMVIKKNLE